MKLEMHTVDTNLFIFLLLTQVSGLLSQTLQSGWGGWSWWNTDHLLIRISLWLIECHFVKYFFDILVINGLCF